MTSMPTVNLRTELTNVAILLALVLIVPMVWLICFNWAPGLLIDQHDNLATGYIFKKQLALAGGDWRQVLYWPGLIGGVLVHDITGSLPIMSWLLSSGVSAATTSNVMTMLLQIFFGYFCLRMTMGVMPLLSPGKAVQRHITVLALAGALFAFLPILGWRVTQGHFAIVQGLFVLMCMTALVLDEVNEERSLATMLLAVVVLAHTFQYNGFQTMYYSVVFGGPFVLAILLISPASNFSKRLSWLTVPLAVYAIAILFSAPKLYGIFLNAFGTESLRSTTDPVIYSYTTATWQDWLTSLPWTAEFLPESRTRPFWHEVNYPFGFTWLLLLLGMWNRERIWLALSIALPLLFALIISTNTEPLSIWIVNSLPMMEAFRVPARMVLPLIILGTVAGVGTLICHAGNREKSSRNIPDILIALMLSVAGFLAPTLYSDIAIPVLILLLLVWQRNASLDKRFLPSACLCLLGLITGSALSGFGDRIHAPIEPPISFETSAEIQQALLEKTPELASPLVRVQPEVMMPQIGTNSSFALGMSTLDGYWFPPARFSRLYAELNEYGYRGVVASYSNHPASKAYSALNKLYNVKYSLSVDASGFITTPTGNITMGEAWISTESRPFTNWDGLTQHLRNATADELKDAAAVLEEPLVTEALEQMPMDCESGQVTAINHAGISSNLKGINLGIASKGTCLLTVAMNYSVILSVTDQQGQSLTTLPAYGSLLGILLPDGTTEVSIQPELRAFTGIQLFPWLATLLLSALLLWSTGALRRLRGR